MIADIVGWVYCEHREYREVPNPPETPSWVTPKRVETACTAKAEAILRYTSYRGTDHMRVLSFVTFVSTGWTSWVDSAGSAHVLCGEHEYKGYQSGTSYHVKS